MARLGGYVVLINIIVRLIKKENFNRKKCIFFFQCVPERFKNIAHCGKALVLIRFYCNIGLTLGRQIEWRLSQIGTRHCFHADSFKIFRQLRQ